jgi:hypothetical protein
MIINTENADLVLHGGREIPWTLGVNTATVVTDEYSKITCAGQRDRAWVQNWIDWLK